MKKKLEVETAFLYQCILELPYFEYGCLVGSSQVGEEAEARREEALMSNICLINPIDTMWRNLLYLVVLYLKSHF